VSNIPNNKEKTIYNLDLHETIYAEIDPRSPLCTSVMRVPGGWIYRSYDKGAGIMAAVFVPYLNEYHGF
jgi:hypothetical protein